MSIRKLERKPISRSFPPKRKVRNHPESDLQRSMLDFYNTHVRPGDHLLFAVPNGEKRDAFTASILKGLGVLSGVSDLILVLPHEVVFIEVKRPAGFTVNNGKLQKTGAGKQSDDQRVFEAKVTKMGHPYHLIDNLQKWVDLLTVKGLVRKSSHGLVIGA